MLNKLRNLNKVSLYAMFLKRIGTQMFSLLSVMIITRMLSVSEFGRYSYLLNTVFWFSMFFDFGLNTFSVSFIMRHKSNYREYSIAAYFNKIRLYIALAASVLVGVFFLFSGLPLVLGILAACVFFATYFNYNWFLIATRKNSLLLMYQLITALFFFGVVALIYSLKLYAYFGLNYTLIFYSLSLLLSTVAIYIKVLHKERNNTETVSIELFKNRNLWNTYLGNISYNAIYAVNFFLLGFFHYDIIMGEYSTYYRIFNAISAIPLILFNDKLPALPGSELKGFINSGIKHSFLFVVIISCLILLFGKPVFMIMFGKKYIYSFVIMFLFVLIYIIYSLSFYTWQILPYIHLEKSFFVISIIVFAVSVLAFGIIKYFNLNAVLYSTLLLLGTIMMGTALGYLQIRRKIKYEAI